MVDEREFDALVAEVLKTPDVRKVRELNTAGAASPGGVARRIRTYVLDVPVELAEHLTQRIRLSPVLRGVVFEEDATFRFEGIRHPFQSSNPLGPASAARTCRVAVLGKNDQPVERATVSLFGSFGAAHAVTDSDGRAECILYGEPPVHVDAIHVSPKSDYWTLSPTDPALDATHPMTVRLSPLEQAFPEFPRPGRMGASGYAHRSAARRPV
jgi:hypothetical protein